MESSAGTNPGMMTPDDQMGADPVAADPDADGITRATVPDPDHQPVTALRRRPGYGRLRAVNADMRSAGESGGREDQKGEDDGGERGDEPATHVLDVERPVERLAAKLATFRGLLDGERDVTICNPGM